MNICLICHWPIAGYHVIRALRAQQHKVHLIYDNNSRSLAVARGVTRAHRFKDLDRTPPDELADVINALHGRIGLDRVIASDMESLTTLAWANWSGSELGQRPTTSGRDWDVIQPPVYPMAPPETLHKLNDKWEFVGICDALGIKTPRSVKVETRHYKAEEVHRDIGFPMIIKPVNKYGGRDIRYANDQLELVQQLQWKRFKHHHAIVQAYIRGQDWGCSVFADRGKVEHWTTFRCPDFKSAEFMPHARLLRACARIVRETNFTGVANFDARETWDRQLFLFECNPRFFTRLSACRVLGLDFVSAGLGEEVKYKLDSGEYYHWTQLLQPHGIKGLVTGRWRWGDFLQDLTEMVSDPFPIVARKLRVL